jgi:uncharacterized membrane protein
MPNSKLTAKRQKVRIGGILKEVITVSDERGVVLHRSVQALKYEMHLHDIVQVIVGSMILAAPIGFTQEVWELAGRLSVWQLVMLFLLSLLFIAIFIYYNDYENSLREHLGDFVMRLCITYILSFAVVGMFMTLIGQAPWSSDLMLSLKRVALVTFPASLSAAVVDMIK